MKFSFPVQFVCLLLATLATSNAANITAASAAPSDIQNAINAAGNGDTVIVPAGNVTWTSGISIPGTKGITVNGTGVIVTRGSTTATLVTITTNATTSTRLTGFTFNQTTADRIITVGGGFSNAKFRIDHCTLYSTATLSVLLVVGNSWGLIDHCTISGDDASELIHNEAWGPVSTNGWTDDVTPGSDQALYVEDCVISKTDRTDPYFWGTSAIQSYYGARTVMRYCTINYAHIDQHGTAGNIGARWWEFYNNHFTFLDQGNVDKFFGIRAGSGVIFNNTIGPGKNWGNGGIQLIEEDTGYPALYQIGRGKNQTLDPAYCWNNWATPSTGSSNVVDGRDFYSNTPKPNYTPYTYPHPLQSQLNTIPTAPPSNARIEIK